MLDQYNITGEDDLPTAMQRVFAHVQAQPSTATITPIAGVRSR
jgi:hypothetical protein